MARLPKYVFCLMLENRSFDHMLGWSGISGTEAATKQRVTVDGLDGGSYPATKGAPWCVPVGPGHEFTDVFQQLTGKPYTPGATYATTTIDNSGFGANYASHGGDPADVLKCFTPDQLPVLHTLASEFVVCDRWFSSMPGPTWPNRFFVHAASSAGLDHSPGILDMGTDYSFEPFRFQHGHVFQYLEEERIFWAVLSGYWLPQSFAMEGMRGYWHKPNLRFIDKFDELLSEIEQQGKHTYVFVEPNYGHIVTDTYRCGTSQHALDDVTRGEWLIKSVYEKLRNSPIWNDSALIITWDEHGGFYDHVAPPAAPPPGDGPYGKNDKFGFAFDRYGVRVPAVVVSPLTEANLVDKRVHDHASVLAFLEECFDLGSFTQRDYAEFKSGATLATLFTRDQPRTDCREELPEPFQVQPDPLPACTSLNSVDAVITLPVFDALDQDPGDTEPGSNLAGFAHIAHLLDVSVSNPDESVERGARFAAVRTARDVKDFLGEVQQRLRERSPKLRTDAPGQTGKPGLLRRIFASLRLP